MSYADKLAKRIGTVKEHSYKCLCCRDYGLIPADNVIRYLGEVFPEIVDEYHDIMTATCAPGIACGRPTCGAMRVWVDVPRNAGDGDGGSAPQKLVNRVADWAIDTLSSELSNWVHQQELTRMQSAASSDERQRVSQQLQWQKLVTTLLKEMPEVEPVSRPAAVVEMDAITEHQGFSVGDRVEVSIAEFDDRDQREIRARGECPHEGRQGVIKTFVRSTVFANSILAMVELEDGTVERFNCGYLMHLIGEVAA